MSNDDKRWHTKRHFEDEGQAACRPRVSLYQRHILTNDHNAVSCAKCFRILNGRWPDRETYFRRYARSDNSLKASL
jgi:hypothetical protein